MHIRNHRPCESPAIVKCKNKSVNSLTKWTIFKEVNKKTRQPRNEVCLLRKVCFERKKFIPESCEISSAIGGIYIYYNLPEQVLVLKS